MNNQDSVGLQPRSIIKSEPRELDLLGVEHAHPLLKVKDQPLNRLGDVQSEPNKQVLNYDVKSEVYDAEFESIEFSKSKTSNSNGKRLVCVVPEQDSLNFKSVQENVKSAGRDEKFAGIRKEKPGIVALRALLAKNSVSGDKKEKLLEQRSSTAEQQQSNPTPKRLKTRHAPSSKQQGPFQCLKCQNIYLSFKALKGHMEICRRKEDTCIVIRISHKKSTCPVKSLLERGKTASIDCTPVIAGRASTHAVNTSSQIQNVVIITQTDGTVLNDCNASAGLKTASIVCKPVTAGSASTDAVNTSSQIQNVAITQSGQTDGTVLNDCNASAGLKTASIDCKPVTASRANTDAGNTSSQIQNVEIITQSGQTDGTVLNDCNASAGLDTASIDCKPVTASRANTDAGNTNSQIQNVEIITQSGETDGTVLNDCNASAGLDTASIDCKPVTASRANTDAGNTNSQIQNVEIITQSGETDGTVLNDCNASAGLDTDRSYGMDQGKAPQKSCKCDMVPGNTSDCNECSPRSKVVLLEENLSRPLDTHLDGKSYRYEMCDNGLCSDKTLSGEKPGECDVGDRESAGPLHVSQSKTIHNEPKTWKCDVCDKEFKKKIALNRHKKNHLEKKPHVCDICGKGCRHRHHLMDHKKTHSVDQPFVCDVCGKAFKQVQTLNDHKNIHTNKRPYKCDVCDKGFNYRNLLYKHKKTHSLEKPYQCDVCSKTFILNAHFKSHKETHTGVKAYKCKLCGKGFTRKHALDHHERSHSGERPYICDFCGLGLGTMQSLVNHKRSHTGEKPYLCDKCGKRYRRQQTFAVHKRTHTNERPYACDVCDKKFKTSYEVTKHKKTHTAEKLRKCDVGGEGKKFEQNGN